MALRYETYMRTTTSGIDKVRRHYLRVPGESSHCGFLEIESGQLHCGDERERQVMRAQLIEEGFVLSNGYEDATMPTQYHPWATYPINGYVRVIASYQEIGRFYLHDRKLTILDESLRAPAEAILQRAGVISADAPAGRAFLHLDYCGSIIWGPADDWPVNDEDMQANKHLSRMIKDATGSPRPLSATMRQAWKLATKAIKAGHPDAVAAVQEAVDLTNWRRYPLLSPEEGVFQINALPRFWYFTVDDGARMLMSEKTWDLFDGDRDGTLLIDARDVTDGLHRLDADLLDKLRIANLPPVMTRELSHEWESVAELLDIGDHEGARKQAQTASQLCGWDRYEETALQIQAHALDLGDEVFEFETHMTMGGETQFFSCPAIPRDYCYLEQASYEVRGETRALRYKLAVAHPNGLQTLRKRVDVEALNDALERVADGLYRIDELLTLAAPRTAGPPRAPSRTVDPIPREELPELLRDFEQSDQVDGGPDFYFWDCRVAAGPNLTGTDLSRLSEELDDDWPAAADELTALLLGRTGGHTPSVFALRAKSLYPNLRELTALPALRGTFYERFGPFHHAGSVAALTFGRLRRHAIWETATTATCPVCRSRFRPDQLDARAVAVLGAAWWCSRCSWQAQTGTAVKNRDAARTAIRLYAQFSGLPPRAGWSANPLPDALEDEQRSRAVMYRMLMPDAESVQQLGGWKSLVGAA